MKFILDAGMKHVYPQTEYMPSINTEDPQPKAAGLY